MPVLADLLGESSEIVAVRKRIQLLLTRLAGARRPPPILIAGETGTGKGLAARAIHGAGPRAEAPFIEVNCAAIPETMLEAELFGYERGAFTDARQAKPGLFQAASGGVIFLDEIGLLPEALQGKLLKVIEEQAVRRLGGTRNEPVDVLVISASNEDLATAVSDGRFRADLYHRLSVLTLQLPPLRERGRDVLLLAEHNLARVRGDYGLPDLALAPDAREALQAYAWPGNVRELANVIERAALLADRPTLTAAMLGLPAHPPPAAPSEARPGSGKARRVDAERLLDTLERTGWNISRTAVLLGVPRHTVRYRIERYGLRRGAAAARAEEAPPPAPAVPVTPTPTILHWARRWLTLVRVDMLEPRTSLSADFSRVIDTFIEKAQLLGGRVEDLSPTSLVTAFGLEPVEDAARRAALAALAIMKAAGRLAGSDGREVAITIALHADQFLVAQRGDTTQIDFDAKRQALAVLEAVSRQSAAGTIAVSAATTALLERRFELATPDEPADAAPAALLIAYRPHGFGIAGHTADFVGRQQELEALQSRVAPLLAGHGSVVAISGEPGIGKSRLLFEFHRRLAGEAITRLEGRCESYGSAVPFLPVVDLLRAYFRIDDRGAEGALGERVAGQVQALDPALEPAVTPLLALLDLPVDDPHWQALEPARRRQRAVEAVSRVLARESQSRPLLVTIEDLQWVDRETEAVIEALITAAGHARMLLVVTYRPEYRPAWQEAPGCTLLRLGPLSEASAIEMLDGLLGPDASLGPVKRLLLERTEGNPFFLEETIRSLAADRILSGRSGAYRLVRPPAALVAPVTVQAVLAARIDRLPPPRRRLLQCASVLGRSAPLRALGRLSGLAEEPLREEIAPLRVAGFFDEARGGAEAACQFKHALTREVAYESLLEDDRRLLHARALAALEEIGPDALGEQAEVRAEHARRGEVWDKAVDYLRVAGARAWQRGAIEETIARYEEALAIVGRLPAGPEADRCAIDVRLDLHAPLMTAGRTQEIAALYPDAERLARRLDDRPRLGQVLQRTSQLMWLGGRYRAGADHAQQALAMAGAADDPVMRLHAQYFLGLHRFALGDYRGALPCFLELVQGPQAAIAARVISVTVPMDVPAWCWAGLASAMLGDVLGATGFVRRGVEIAEASDFPQSRVIARTIEAIVMACAGRPAECLEPLGRAVELCERIGFFVWLAAASSTLGLVLARTGQPVAALPLLERGVVINEKTGVRTYHGQRHTWWAEGLLRAGRLEEARAHAEAGVTLAGTMEERGMEAEALLVRALVARAESADDAAREWFTRALAAATAVGARPFAAHGHLGLAEVLERLGARADARDHREAGEAMLREMGLRPWWPVPVVT